MEPEGTAVAGRMLSMIVSIGIIIGIPLGILITVLGGLR